MRRTPGPILRKYDAETPTRRLLYPDTQSLFNPSLETIQKKLGKPHFKDWEPAHAGWRIHATKFMSSRTGSRLPTARPTLLKSSPANEKEPAVP